MESFEDNNVNNSPFLEPPSSLDYTEEDDVKVKIKPRFSPLPRRRSSVSSDDGELEPPPTVARKVSFADAFGFDLVSVKEFDSNELPVVLPTLVTEITKIEEFYLTPNFILPPIFSMERLRAKKLILESADFIVGTTSMKGVVRVLNLSYEKRIYVRMSMDEWRSFSDQVAEYVPDSSNGETDQFCFTISLGSPYQTEGAQLEFCICYETAVGTFWDNNDGHNYVLTCQKRERFVETNKASEDVTDKNKKSCLKPALSKDEDDTEEFEVGIPGVKETYIPRIICSHDEFTEDNHEEGKEDKRADDNNEEESDLELFLSQRLMKAKITSSDEKGMETADKSTLPNEGQQDIEQKYSTDDLSHYSQELESFDNRDKYPPETAINQTPATEDIITTPNTSYHSEGQESFSPDYLHEKEEEETTFSPAETCDTHLDTQKTQSFPQDSSMDDTEILDHNANPSNTVHMEYFLTDDNEGGDYESDQNAKIEEESSTSTSDFSHYDDASWKSSENEEAQTSTFSELDVHVSLACQYEPSDSAVPQKEHTESSRTGFVSSDETYFFRDSKVAETAEGRISQTMDLDHVSEISEEKQTSDFQDKSSSAAHQYYVTAQDDSTTESNKECVIHDTESFILTHKEEEYNIKYPLYEDIENVLDETTKTVLDVPEADLSCQRGGSLPEMSLLTCFPAENMTSAKLHVTNESLGTAPSEVTSGSKVIIAKITEEKGQSETCSQGRDDRKRLYIDMCGSGGMAEPTSVHHEQKGRLISEGNIDVAERPKENLPMTVDRESVEVDESSHNVPKVSEDYLTHEGFGYVSKELNTDHIQDKSDDVLSESNIRHVNVNHVAQPSKITEVRDVELRHDVIEEDNSKLAVEDIDLDLNITDDSTIDEEILEDIQYDPEYSYNSPSILISEPDDEGEVPCNDNEDLEDLHEYYNHPITDHENHADKDVTTDRVTTEHLNMNRVRSKVLCFIMFVVFAGLMYHYDFLVCFALYLFSLYWLYWEGDRGKNIIKKE